jgi:hypothetical protein
LIIGGWLRGLGLGQYEATFRESEIDAEVLPDLTESDADVFIEFLKRLLIGETRKVFLIVDRGPAHRAKKTKACVATLPGRLRVFFLPPYSPDRNPDELVRKHLKADTVSHMVVTDKTDFKGQVISLAWPAKAPKEALLILPKTFPTTCPLIMNLLMDRLIHAHCAMTARNLLKNQRTVPPSGPNVLS